jgi:hypothetical protein
MLIAAAGVTEGDVEWVKGPDPCRSFVTIQVSPGSQTLPSNS